MIINWVVLDCIFCNLYTYITKKFLISIIYWGKLYLFKDVFFKGKGVSS